MRAGIKIRVPGVYEEEAADPPSALDLSRGAQFFDVGGLQAGVLIKQCIP